MCVGKKSEFDKGLYLCVAKRCFSYIVVFVDGDGDGGGSVGVAVSGCLLIELLGYLNCVVNVLLLVFYLFCFSRFFAHRKHETNERRE